MPDIDVAKLLSVPGSTAFAVAVGAGGVVLGAKSGWLSLDALPPWVVGSIALVGLLALPLSFARLWDSFSKQRRAKRHLADKKTHAIAYLDTFSDKEREILSYLVMKNQRSFEAPADGGYASTLRQNGLVVAVSRGIADLDNTPHTVPKYLWDELQARRGEFQTADLGKPLPWFRPWGA